MARAVPHIEKSDMMQQNEEAVTVINRSLSVMTGRSRKAKAPAPKHPPITADERVLALFADDLRRTLLNNLLLKLVAEPLHNSGWTGHLDNLWEEFCVYAQDWDEIRGLHFDSVGIHRHIEQLVGDALHSLSALEQSILWISSTDGLDWRNATCGSIDGIPMNL